MPAYDYQCNKCKAVYELRQGFDAETTHTCEQCGKGVAKRILATPAVVFKGSGWYKTDSRGKSSHTPDSSDTAAAKTDSPAEAKSEPKAAEPASTSSDTVPASSAEAAS